MIPMRDGIKLYTVIFTPVNAKSTVPILLTRTPYSASFRFPDNTVVALSKNNFNYYDLAREGYIFVFQDIRGKYKSEGKMEMNRPMYHLTDPKAIDESTDLSRDRGAEDSTETGRAPDSAFGPRRSSRPSAAQPDQRLRPAHGARALWLSATAAGQPGH